MFHGSFVFLASLWLHKRCILGRVRRNPKGNCQNQDRDLVFSLVSMKMDFSFHPSLLLDLKMDFRVPEPVGSVMWVYVVRISSASGAQG